MPMEKNRNYRREITLVRRRWGLAPALETVAALVTLSRPRLSAPVPERCHRTGEPVAQPALMQGTLYCGEVGQMSEFEEWHV